MLEDKKTILLVEDDELLAFTEMRWIKRAGYACIHAPSGEEALFKLQNKDAAIDLILMDIDLGGGIDGAKTAEKILSFLDIPILFLTSHTEKDFTRKTEHIASYGFVVKSPDETVLLLTIKMVLKLHDVKKQLNEQKKDLLSSQEKYRSITDNLPGVVFQLFAKQNGEIGFNYVSERSNELLELENEKVEDFLERFTNRLANGDKKKFLASIIESVKTFSKWEFESSFIKPDGGELYFKLFSQPRLVDDELLFDGVLIDITDQKKVEMAFQDEKSFEEAIFNSVPGLLYMYDEQNNLIRWNRKHEEITGYSSEELAEMNLLDWYRGDEKSISTVSEVVRKCMENGFGDCNAELQKKDGTKIPFYFTASKLCIKGKKYLVGIGIDMLERKRAQKDIALYAQSIRSISQGVTITDLENKILFINKAFLDIYGYTEEELIGNHISIVRADENINYGEIIDETLYGKWKGELINRKKDGTIFPISLSTSSVLDEQGEPIALIGVMSDISEQKETEIKLESYRLHLEELIEVRTKELEKVNRLLNEEVIKVKEGEEKVKQALNKEIEFSRLKSQFVSTASHEFRTPLTTILAAADLLERYGTKWPEQKYLEYINIIQHTVEYMTELINDVLVFSSSEEGKIKFSPLNVDLNKLVLQIIEHAKLYSPTNISFNMDNNTDKKFFFIDYNLVKQILSNLVSNAVKYSPNGGIISIIIDYKFPELILTVSDEGIGIPKEDQYHLFEPFTRATNIGAIPGTGLGLSIIKKSTELHNGKILMKSKLNKGTTFSVILNVTG